MTSLLESTEAFRARALEVSLSPDEVEAMIRTGASTMAKLAFAACHPGQTPTDQQIQDLFGGAVRPTLSTMAAAKRLVFERFEAHSMIAAEIKAKVTKREDSQHTTATLAPAERENRVADQRSRLPGLRLRGEEECAHSCYNLVLQMIERDVLLYHAPERYITR